ncbi:MAPEG family protein [Marinihelvus fidelis]|uniref:MAPEG family protein n=1 Tax=Marinihelvus fidelis TaxID=2613842 RepID=A0A5N0TBY4_9GAMM|nr:MAPEG family protein [Marinihelvus fidelis]KAA9132535.1 MAPEG family protein [Marinihelvus fidelis]
MINLDQYTSAFWGLFVVLLVLLVQWLVASGSKALREGAIPGKIDPSLSHSSFVFRAHRTFMNSLENLPAMLGASFLAILVGASALWTGVFIWVFAAARIAHMALYYAIATEKNPSPRSYFFMLGSLANIGLLGLCAVTLV